MIKVFLKHLIYEKCISIIFDLFKKNLVVPDTGKIRKGDTFKIIEIYDYFKQTSKTYYDVKLIGIDKYTFFGEKCHSYTLEPIHNKHVIYKLMMGTVKNFEK